MRPSDPEHSLNAPAHEARAPRSELPDDTSRTEIGTVSTEFEPGTGRRMTTVVVIAAGFLVLGFLAVGIFVTYGVYDGFGDVFARAAAVPKLHRMMSPIDGVAGIQRQVEHHRGRAFDCVASRIAERAREDNRRERVPVTGSAETEA